MALILRFFSQNSIALQAHYVTVVQDKPVMSVKYCLPVPVFYFWPKLTHPAALSAIAEHLVCNVLLGKLGRLVAFLIFAVFDVSPLTIV